MLKTAYYIADTDSSKRHFSIFHTCILLGFLRGLNFCGVAEGIGVSLNKFYSMYVEMLEMTGAHNKKELIAVAKKMKAFSHLFNKDGRIKRGVLRS